MGTCAENYRTSVAATARKFSGRLSELLNGEETVASDANSFVVLLLGSGDYDFHAGSCCDSSVSVEKLLTSHFRLTSLVGSSFPLELPLLKIHSSGLKPFHLIKITAPRLSLSGWNLQFQKSLPSDFTSGKSTSSSWNGRSTCSSTNGTSCQTRTPGYGRRSEVTARTGHQRSEPRRPYCSFNVTVTARNALLRRVFKVFAFCKIKQEQVYFSKVGILQNNRVCFPVVWTNRFEAIC